MKYYVRYVESCTPRLKVFDTEHERIRFIIEFEEDRDDNWIDLVFNGEVIYDSEIEDNK